MFLLFDKELRKVKIDRFISDGYLGPCQTSKIVVFAKMNNGFQPLTVFAKSFIIEVLLGSEYTSDNRNSLFEELKEF